MDETNAWYYTVFVLCYLSRVHLVLVNGISVVCMVMGLMRQDLSIFISVKPVANSC